MPPETSGLLGVLQLEGIARNANELRLDEIREQNRLAEGAKIGE